MGGVGERGNGEMEMEIWMGWDGMGDEKEERYIPPDFFAPNLFPGPSFALLTAPCAACEA